MVHMRTLMVVVLGAIVVGLPVFSPMLRAKKGPATATEATGPQLERDIPELMKKAGVPGLAIAVILGGKTTWLHGFGMKEVKTGQPVTGPVGKILGNVIAVVTKLALFDRLIQVPPIFTQLHLRFVNRDLGLGQGRASSGRALLPRVVRSPGGRGSSSLVAVN